MPPTGINQGLLDFIRTSPTPFHAVTGLSETLRAEGFVPLDETENWTLQPGGRYLVTRNDSSLIAFRLGSRAPEEAGFRLVGAHTDSPCLHVKPLPVRCAGSYVQLAVEVYGGALLNPWFDRDLSIAGRISFRDADNRLGSALIDFERPVAVIPSLAIHLDREANSQRSINAQQHIVPVLMLAQKDKRVSVEQLLIEQARRQHPALEIDRLLDHELSLYDTQPPAIIGIENEFIAAARLDNLLSCHVGMHALVDARGDQNALLVCSDHEEVGSTSACGADGPFLHSVLERICGSGQTLARTVNRSWLVSADNAHGVHPNYPDKHDDNHGPVLNRGPVIKVNANQRYATNSETAALFRHLCEQAGVPVQSFVMRNDMACGSTIGPITAAGIGVRTLDVGVPTFAMHSIRELAGSRDTDYLYKALTAFYRHEN
jgi:aspartyl aminopeptidase